MSSIRAWSPRSGGSRSSSGRRSAPRFSRSRYDTSPRRSPGFSTISADPMSTAEDDESTRSGRRSIPMRRPRPVSRLTPMGGGERTPAASSARSLPISIIDSLPISMSVCRVSRRPHPRCRAPLSMNGEGLVERRRFTTNCQVRGAPLHSWRGARGSGGEVCASVDTRPLAATRGRRHCDDADLRRGEGLAYGSSGSFGASDDAAAPPRSRQPFDIIRFSADSGGPLALTPGLGVPPAQKSTRRLRPTCTVGVPRRFPRFRPSRPGSFPTIASLHLWKSPDRCHGTPRWTLDSRQFSTM